MTHQNKENQSNKNLDENWINDLLERQEEDIEVEEEILSSVPSRIKHKYLEEDEE